MKIKTKYILLGALFIVAFTYASGWYYGHSNGQSEIKKYKEAIAFKDNEIVRYMIQLDGVSRTMYQKDQVIKTQAQAIRDGDIQRKDLRAINLSQASEITMLKMRIDTMLKDVQHNGQIVDIPNSQITNTVPQKAIVLPFMFEKKDQWLSFKGLFDENGTLGVDMSMVLGLDLYTGIDKKTKHHVIKLTTDNPYIRNIELTSYKTDYKPPTKNGIGIQIGYGVGIINNKPQTFGYVGLGFSRNFIRW